jgi:hypothetical protein
VKDTQTPGPFQLALGIPSDATLPACAASRRCL